MHTENLRYIKIYLILRSTQITMKNYKKGKNNIIKIKLKSEHLLQIPQKYYMKVNFMCLIYFSIFEDIKQLCFSKFLDPIFPGFKIYVISRFFKRNYWLSVCKKPTLYRNLHYRLTSYRGKINWKIKGFIWWSEKNYVVSKFITPT